MQTALNKHELEVNGGAQKSKKLNIIAELEIRFQSSIQLFEEEF